MTCRPLDLSAPLSALLVPHCTMGILRSRIYWTERKRLMAHRKLWVGCDVCCKEQHIYLLLDPARGLLT
jgi:hypothetical protein